MKAACERGDALTTSEKMHRQRVGILFATEKHELLAQPRPEQGEQLVRLRLRSVIELRKLATQRANRAAIALYVGPVGDQDVDSALSPKPCAACSRVSHDSLEVINCGIRGL